MAEINKIVFGKRLKSLMNSFKETTSTISKLVDLSAPTISRYIRGEMAPKMSTVRELAYHFNVNPKWLAGEKTSIYQEELIDLNDESTTIPIFQSIKYELPIFSNKKIREELKVPLDRLTDWGSVIATVMPDNSMSPTIFENDRLVIKLNPQLESHKLAALHINNSDLIIRRVVKDGKYIIVQPDNIDEEAQVYNINQDNIQIIGNVVYSQHINENYFE